MVMKCNACGTENEKGQEYCVYCGAPIPKKKKGVLIGIIVGIVAMLSIIIGVTTVLIVNQNNSKAYEESLELGTKYLAEMNYEQAIIQYQKLIDLEPKNEEGYLGLAKAYMGTGDYVTAESTIQEGITMTNAASLRDLLQLLYQERENVTISTRESNNLQEVEVSNVTLNSALITVIGDASYSDYSWNYGSGNVNYSSTTGVAEVTYTGFDGTCIYYDIATDGYIIDEKTSLPYANKKPNEVTFDSIESIFENIDGIITMEKLEEITGATPALSFDSTIGKNVVSVVYGNCLITIETDESGNIVDMNAWNQVAPIEQEWVTDSDLGSLSGEVIDAVTGQGVSATIKVREGHGKSGSIVEKIDTNSRGEYLFEGADGEYTFEVSKSGYITEYFEVEIANQVDVSDEDLVISPELAEGEIRVVLEWGDQPSDLDTHVGGILGDGSSFYISYFEKTYTRNGEVIANLDVDDTNGNGPETFTISDTNASFEYWVEDFTESGLLSSSGATVKVYLPNESSPKSFSVPSGLEYIWEVFKYENGQITAMY